MSDEVSDLADVPRRESHWPATLTLWFPVLLMLTSPATRRAVTGQDGPAWQGLSIVMLAWVCFYLVSSVFGAIKARHEGKI